MILKGTAVMTDQPHAKTQASTSTTIGVFALMKAKPGVTRERVMAIMPAEIRATVQLYLDGKIRDWYRVKTAREVSSS
jgi:type IV secretory pathway protease TraF